MPDIPRINLFVSEELHRLIEEHAKRAGMSVPAYVREKVAVAAGRDSALALVSDRIAELEREIERLRGKGS